MDAGDSAFFAWAIGWERHALPDRPRAPAARRRSSTRCATRWGWTSRSWAPPLLVVPLGPFTDDAVLLFNVARLLTFVLSALTAYLLARELGCAEGPALFAGAAFAFSPIRTDQIAHLSTLGTQWLPLVLLFMRRYFARRARVRRAARRRPASSRSRPTPAATTALIALAVLPPAALVLLWGRWRRLPARVRRRRRWPPCGLLPLYLLHKRGARSAGLRARHRRDGGLFGGARVLPGHHRRGTASTAS